MLSIQLYDYQKEMKRRIDTAFCIYRSVMVQMPTGIGKTHLLASVVEEYAQKEGDAVVWIVAHRKELVAQIERTVSRFGITVNSQNPEECRVRVYSIQWLSRHLEEMKDSPR